MHSTRRGTTTKLYIYIYIKIKTILYIYTHFIWPISTQYIDYNSIRFVRVCVCVCVFFAQQHARTPPLRRSMDADLGKCGAK